MRRALMKLTLRLGAIAELVSRWRGTAQAVAGVVAIGLGFWGFMLKSPPTEVHGWLNNIFRTVQLITLHFPTEFDGALPWQLQVGRLAVPIVAFLASLHVVVGTITRPMRLAILPMTRDHIVFFGVSKLSDKAMSSLIAQGHRLILVHPTIEGERLSVLEGLGVTVISADPFEASVIQDLALARAQAAFVSMGDDVANANLAAMIMQKAGKRDAAAEPIVLAVEFEREDLATELVAAVDDLARRGGFRFYRLAPDREGLTLELTRYAPAFSPARGEARAHVLVAGLHGSWEMVLSQLLLALQDRPDETPVLSLILDAAEVERFSVWCAARPQIELVVDIEILRRGASLMPPEAAIDGWSKRTPPPQLAVILRDDGDAIATALALRRPGEPLRTRGAALLVRQSREDRILSLLPGFADEGAIGGAVRPFGGLLRRETIERLLDRAGERMAIRLHAAYLGRAAELGVTSARVLEAWERLPENIREANRAAAAHLPILLAAVGHGPSDFDAEALSKLSEADLERLAQLEHRRWCADRINHGWSYAPSRDDARRLHPCLVPWEALSEPERQKDRNGVRVVLEAAAQDFGGTSRV